jgi:diguanylate cyclase (GGDEF)-like protein
MGRTSSAAKTATPRTRQKLRFEAAVRNISEGLCMFDGRRRLVMCNERYAAIYGLPPELTKPGTSHARISKYRLDRGMQPIGAEGFLERHEELMHEAKAAVLTVTLKTGRVISIHHQPMADGGWVSTHYDITEQVVRARELEVQSLRFESAINNMTQGLCMFDRDKRLVVSNHRYAEMYNISPEAVKPGMTLDEIFLQRFEAGNLPVEGSRVFLDKRLGIAGDNQPCAFDIELMDGRIIKILHRPCADGGWVATHEDVTEQRRNQARIRHLARHDALTDLPNRASFSDHLDQVKGRVQNGEIVSVLCIDLDYFKCVNDMLGHAVGDAALKQASQRLLACVRDGDAVARLGGDEFAAVVGRLDRPEEAGAVAERIVKSIARPFDIEGHQVLIGASVGIAVAPIDGKDGDSLMKHADLALYRAKSDGRGAHHFYECGMDAALQERRSTEAALREALLKGEFRLVFQPLINLAENRVCGFEALLRWQNRERGLLAPGCFIAIAEETGLIGAIGEWVLHEACATAARWPEHVSVAVNLSPVQFRRNRNLVEQVKSALAASSLNPERLELEITESVLLADDESALLVLRQLKELGVRVALDDFGTGYSSLSYLRRFPFDKIKIDRSFVQESLKSPDSLAIVKAVIGLGRSLGIATTAEGVETAMQLDIVREQGCTEVQGFLFSVPLPANAASELIARFHGSEDASQELRRAG